MSRPDDKILRIITLNILPYKGNDSALFNYGTQAIEEAPDPFVLTRSDPLTTLQQLIAPLIEQYTKYGKLQTSGKSTANKIKLVEIRGKIHQMKRSINMELETSKLLIERRRHKYDLAYNHCSILMLDIQAAKHYLSNNQSTALEACLPQLEFHYDKYMSSIEAVRIEIDTSLAMVDMINAFMSDVVSVWDENIKSVGRTLDLTVIDHERKKWTKS